MASAVAQEGIRKVNLDHRENSKPTAKIDVIWAGGKGLWLNNCISRR